MSEELGKIIQLYREKAGLTQDELGKIIGVSQQTIAKWEAGKSFPRPKALANVVSTLKIDSKKLKKPGRENEPHVFLDDLPDVVQGLILDDPDLYPWEKKSLEKLPPSTALPSKFPFEARFSYIAHSTALKKLLAPVVDALEPASKWDALVRAPFGNCRVDYMNDELYATFLHAPNAMILTSHLRTTVFRYLWRYMTFSEQANYEGKYQILVITLPDDQPIDIEPTETRQFVPPVSNTRMLRRLTSEALSQGIYILVARTPEDVASILTNPARMNDPGWDWTGREWDENPDT